MCSPMFCKNLIKEFLMNLQEKLVMQEKMLQMMLNIIWELHQTENSTEILFMLV